MIVIVRKEYTLPLIDITYYSIGIDTKYIRIARKHFSGCSLMVRLLLHHVAITIKESCTLLRQCLISEIHIVYLLLTVLYKCNVIITVLLSYNLWRFICVALAQIYGTTVAIL